MFPAKEFNLWTPKESVFHSSAQNWTHARTVTSKHTNKHTWDTHTHSYKLPWWFMSATVRDHFPKGRTLTSDPSSGRKQFSSPSERSHPYSRLSSSSFTSVCLIHRSSPPAHLYSLPSPNLFVMFPSPPLHLLSEGAYQAESRYELWAGFVIQKVTTTHPVNM